MPLKNVSEGSAGLPVYPIVIKLKSNLPIFEVRGAWGIKNLVGSEYQYLRLNANISQNARIPRWGKINYILYGGNIFTDESLPFMLLEMHPGNEIYYYNKQC